MTALGILALWVFFRWVLSWVLPFLIAMLAAKLMEPAVNWLHKRLKLPRGIGAAIMTFFVVGALSWLTFWGLSSLVYEVKAWAEDLPLILAGLPDMITSLEVQFEVIIMHAPVQLQEFLRGSLQSIFDGGALVPGELYGKLADWVGRLAAGFPSVMLFTAALVLSTYFISSDYPHVTGFMVRQVPEKWRVGALELYHRIMQTMGKWLRAQGLLMLIAFVALLIGLYLLRVEHAFVVSLLIAVVDALPMLGAGLALLPWAVYCLVIGDTAGGIGLAVLFAIVSLLRGFLEPKLIGSQIGLHPLITLAGMYAGFRIAGIGGMILFPLLIVVLKQLHEWGFFKKIIE